MAGRRALKYQAADDSLGALPWTVRVGMVKVWDDGTETPPDEVAEACRVLATGDKPPGLGPLPAGPTDAADAMRQFRAADLQLGGGHMYPVVLRYLRTMVAPRLVADDDSVFTTAAALSDMAGWMAHDAGHDDVALRHFRRARDLVAVSGDRQVAAHVLASSGHLAHHTGKPAEAITASRAGLAALVGGPRIPGLEARLHAIGARGYSALGEQAGVTRALTLAEQALGAAPDDQLSEWVSTFDEGTLAGEAARCLRAVGQLGAAQRHAARVIELRPASRPRSRALGMFVTAQIALAQGQPDEAAAVAAGILATAGALGSYVVVRQFQHLAHTLAPYQAARPIGRCRPPLWGLVHAGWRGPGPRSRTTARTLQGGQSRPAGHALAALAVSRRCAVSRAGLVLPPGGRPADDAAAVAP